MFQYVATVAQSFSTQIFPLASAAAICSSVALHSASRSSPLASVALLLQLARLQLSR